MSTATLPSSGRAPAPPELRERVRRLIEREGVVGAAKLLGLSRQTVTTIGGGFPANVGSLVQADQRAPL